MNPLRGEIVWQYPQTESDFLKSRVRGASQQLPNGNVLITESNRGRVFEVERDGSVVWEFFNPLMDGKKSKRRRATIYRMRRFPFAMFPRLPVRGS